jgi:hypothetical protein
LIEERAARGNVDVKSNARILARRPIDDGEDNPLGNAGGGSDPQFTCRGVGEKLDVPDSLVAF